MSTLEIPCDIPPWRLSGTVYGALLNHRSALDALGSAAQQPPYGKAPVAPVLYLKPRNTLAGEDAVVVVPAESGELEVGACLGCVVQRTACRVGEATALEFLAGFLIINDVCVPHASVYRPSVRLRARDGFCPMGPKVTARSAIPRPDALAVRVFVDEVLVTTVHTADLVRPVARLIADVTEFMTLAPGDVLAVGVAQPAPRVRAGQVSRIEIDGLGALTTRYVAERA